MALAGDELMGAHAAEAKAREVEAGAKLVEAEATKIKWPPWC